MVGILVAGGRIPATNLCTNDLSKFNPIDLITKPLKQTDFKNN